MGLQQQMYMGAPSDMLMQPIMTPSMTGYYPTQLYPQASQVGVRGLYIYFLNLRWVLGGSTFTF
jgi:hypothetical protein